ncbi:class I SAM-dependent DNA methyltransferase [Breznakia blatticola]|nr:class I SAM-dependent methyltransferase [Breznakia blatticola]
MVIYQDWKPMYNQLAKHYDSLVKDDDATQAYVDFTKKYAKGKNMLELACGSGEISLALAKTGYQLVATDLSNQMLDEARKKDVEGLVDYAYMNMYDMSQAGIYDTVICYCDSMNYIDEQHIASVLKQVYDHLEDDGIFLFDMHALDRLDEFKEEFYEAGKVDDTDFIWSIISDENRLLHNFVFYEKDGSTQYEHHEQWVFNPNQITSILTELGFQVEIYTDFVQPGIQEGEKYFYVCRKEVIA